MKIERERLVPSGERRSREHATRRSATYLGLLSATGDSRDERLLGGLAFRKQFFFVSLSGASAITALQAVRIGWVDR